MKKSGILLVFLGLGLLHIAFYPQSSTASLLYFTQGHWQSVSLVTQLISTTHYFQ